MIHIFYRHYNVSGREDWRPDWFDYEKCWLNLFEQTNKNDSVKINIVFDGTSEDNFIFKYKYDKLFRIDAKGDLNSFQETLNIIHNQDNEIKSDDIIYLLENDYLHKLGWIDKVYEFFESQYKDNYLSLYDHQDKYFKEYQNLESKIHVTKSHHFRTTPSTCGSFLLTKKIFDEDFHFNLNVFSFLRSNTRLPLDHAKFLIMEKVKDRKVFSPIPGLSTHCLNGLTSPTINWENIINE
jgi:hypothetical protein